MIGCTWAPSKPGARPAPFDWLGVLRTAPPLVYGEARTYVRASEW